MTDAAHVRAFALSLPEAAEAPHFDSASFRVRGKIFAGMPAGELTMHAYVSDDETHAFVGENPAAFEELWWGKKMWGVRVNLAVASPADVEELIEGGWRRKAPKKVVAAFDAAR